MFKRSRMLLEDMLGRGGAPARADVAAQEAVAWIYRAQDATPDRGVSHSYHVRDGWAQSYPETTGYIIPTLFNWSVVTGDAEPRQRALEMADWETEVQLPDGGVMGSVVGRGSGRPVVFNTGQVIFGWLAAYRETAEEKYLVSATRAGQWLLERLGDDQTWSTHGSMGEDRVHTYNVRVAWALLELGRTVGDHSYSEAARRVIKWALRQENAPGWFACNCLTCNEKPLLHTIGYTARGLFEAGRLLDDGGAIDAAKRTADAVVSRLRADGSLAGRFDSRWGEKAKWCCLTGMAQMSIVMLKLYAFTKQRSYLESSTKINRFLTSRQRVRCADLGVRGGLPGSFPINGEYGKYRILNWATKFFIDAALLEAHLTMRTPAGFYAG